MPQRFIFSLRFANKLFWKFVVLALTSVFFMTLFRANLYFISIFHATPDAVAVEIFQAFFAGIRFDLLIYGFVLIPVVFLLLLQAVAEKWPGFVFVFYRLYFGAVWLIICAMNFVDFFFFTKFGRHMRSADYQQWQPDSLLTQWHALQPNQAWIFLSITCLLLILGLMLVKALKFGIWKDEFSPDTGSAFEISWRIVLPFVLVALAARGTVEAHHLELAHSVVSDNTVINEMALNAVWCFDK